MARKSGPVYLEYKGWFWVEWIGQRSIYHGPYRSEAIARKAHKRKDQDK
jgi:hypothetical protein